MTVPDHKENLVPTPYRPLTPAPVRQAAICMCASGGACSSFAPGHAVHLIQARLVSATPAEWVDAIVGDVSPADGTLVLHTLSGDRVEVWNGAGAADSVSTGSPVAFHPRYHVVAAGAARFNVLV
ncbi:hypothetical protein [Microbacterium telephonicum]|uniref:Uncharacterized protein n=1 Tax=Microbacterium telephonicum TaxID=1714841 RepID=A0A498CBU5_9MICO|nr:hypothetical protein [Microbacterium telephonicum]RLK49681.1 hypothetical protein C7474_1842 [Microbacterium telephonicum]